MDQGEATAVVSKEAAVTLLSPEGGGLENAQVCLSSDLITEWSVPVLVRCGHVVVLSDVDVLRSCLCPTRKHQLPATGARLAPRCQWPLFPSSPHPFNKHFVSVVDPRCPLPDSLYSIKNITAQQNMMMC